MEEINYQIRPVRPSDLAAVTEVEAVCFPAAEAASFASDAAAATADTSAAVAHGSFRTSILEKSRC